jgi:hypothetical protein
MQAKTYTRRGEPGFAPQLGAVAIESSKYSDDPSRQEKRVATDGEVVVWMRGEMRTKYAVPSKSHLSLFKSLLGSLISGRITSAHVISNMWCVSHVSGACQ